MTSWTADKKTRTICGLVVVASNHNKSQVCKLRAGHDGRCKP